MIGDFKLFYEEHAIYLQQDIVNFGVMRYYLTIIIALYSIKMSAGGPWLTQKKSGFFQLQSTFPAGAYSNLFLGNGKTLKLNRKVFDYNFQSF